MKPLCILRKFIISIFFAISGFLNFSNLNAQVSPPMQVASNICVGPLRAAYGTPLLPDANLNIYPNESASHEGYRARLFNPYHSGTFEWYETGNLTHSNYHLDINLGVVKNVNGIIIQGRTNSHVNAGLPNGQFISSVRISYSSDNVNWITAGDFNANFDDNTLVTIMLPNGPVQARYVRILGLSTVGASCLRADVISIPCGSGSHNVSVSAQLPIGYDPSQYTLAWYAAPTGGAAIATGLYLTRSISQSTTYYVAVRRLSDNAESVRVPVTAYVSSVPTAPPVITNPSNTCVGPVELSVDISHVVRESQPSLIAHYPFSNNLSDVSGRNMNLSVTAGTVDYSGGGLTFNVTNNARFESVANNWLSGSQNHTISFYYKRTTNTDTVFGKIFTWAPNGDRSPGIYMLPTGIHWRYDSDAFPCCTPSSNNTGIDYAGLNLNQWYHVVGVKKGANFKIYIDGVLVGNVTAANPIRIGNAPFVFGMFSPNRAPYGVVIRDFKIFDRAMEPSGVSQIAQWKWYTGSCGGTYIGSGPSITVNPSVTTTYYVRSENACGKSACTSITVYRPVGNPSVFGTNIWNVYGYAGQDINLGAGVTYYGYYTQDLANNQNYGFNTQDIAHNGWNNTYSPSVSTAWQGCPLPDDNFTFVHKRRGFPCGTYQLTMVDWDDETRIYLNGSQIWNCPQWYGGGVCALQASAGAVANIGVFDLDGNSTIEVRTGEGGVTAHARLDIVPLTNQLANNNDSRTCPVAANSGWSYLTPLGSGRVILGINPGNQNLGNVTATAYVQGAPINIVDCAKPTNSAYDRVTMGRSWRITSTNPPTGNVTIRLPFTDTEFTQLQTAANSNTNAVDDIANLTSLKLTKYSSATNEDHIFGNNTNTCPTGGTFSFHNQVISGVNPFTTGSSYVEFIIPSFSELWLHGSSVNNSPLPVELVYFLGKCEEGNVNFQWSTASEQNNAFFILERSLDGENWEYVDRISGAGNSNEQLMYTFIDQKSYGNYYYRLVQQDYDGSSEVLAVLFVNCYSLDANSIHIFPNPAEGYTTIQVNALEDVGESSLQIISLDGKEVYNKTVQLQKGVNDFHFDASSFLSGTYIVHVLNSKINFSYQKLIII